MQSSSVKEAFREALREARSSERPRLSGEVIVAASPGAEPPARVLYLGVLHSGSRSVYTRPSEAALHFMPYRDFDATLVVFTLDPKDTRALHAVEAAVNLGVSAYVVAPRLHPAYEERLRELGSGYVRIESRSPLLAMTLAALHWVPDMQGFRRERFRAEVESLDDAAEWVEENYGRELEEAREAVSGGGGLAAYYTPTGYAGARYLSLALGTRTAPLEEAPKIGSPGVAFMASVEEPSYRDVLLSARVRGLKLHVININTDPVTAGIYSVIAAALIAGKAI